MQTLESTCPLSAENVPLGQGRQRVASFPFDDFVSGFDVNPGEVQRSTRSKSRKRRLAISGQ